MNERIPRAIVRYLHLTSVSLYALLSAKTFAVEAQTGEDGRWWPTQVVPATLIRLDQKDFPAAGASYAMTAQSISGLAAKAVNEGRCREMVWVGNGDANLERWYARLSARHSDTEFKGVAKLWDLIDRYADKGIIRGYILYKSDDSNGDYNQHRPGMDCSVNVATSLSGILDGIIVDEVLEPEAKARGLKRLADVRDKTQAWCFEKYKDRFNRRILCTQDPRKPHIRDLAIAQNAFVTYGYDEPILEVMQWLEPLSPILGWNGGDEFKTTDMSTRWGHIQTCTDWCYNLPVLMAGSQTTNHPKIPTFDPRTIDWKDQRDAVSFVSTDGDNVQWFQGNFFHSGNDASYWGNPERGAIPFGWSCCFSQSAQLCPETVDYAIDTRSPNDAFIEWGGGYYYPDRFASSRPNRWELLAEQARRTWVMMKKNNARMIGFNFANCDSTEAHRAYEVIAGQTDKLLAMLIFQYAPYEAGAGKTFWVKDRTGIDLPVITARYSIWENSNRRERAGTPAKIAREITQTVERTPQVEQPRYDWIITHVWSYFKNSPGTDEDAENMRQENALAEGGVRGYSPAVWCANRLPANIRVMGPEEMAWRIRMRHDPSQTQQFISQFK